MPAMVLLVLSLLLCMRTPLAAQVSVDPDEGTLSSVRPRIPEPMVFDLVRPLGAERGELEVNSLFRVTRADPTQLQWAPEVEYAFAKGYGIEFELPMVDGSRESVKLALQGTLPGPARRVFIHGWQGLWERGAQGGVKTDLLYLAGARFHERWSAFTMTGVRREDPADGAGGFGPVGNYSMFFHPTAATSYGLETNLSRGAAGGGEVVVMPQVHVRRSRYNVQAGVGLRRGQGQTRLQVSWRVSREF